MKRIWLLVRESTIALAVEALKRVVPLDHWYNRNQQANELDDAAEDLKRAKRLADAGATRDEIEAAMRERDAGKKGGP